MHHALFLSISRKSTFVVFDNVYYFPLFNSLVGSVRPMMPEKCKKSVTFFLKSLKVGHFSRAAGHFEFFEEFFLALSNSIDHLLLSWHFHHAKSMNELAQSWSGLLLYMLQQHHSYIEELIQYINNFSDNIDRHLMMTTYVFLFSQDCFHLKN